MITWIITVFHIFFYQPLLNVLVFLYVIIPGQDLGISIILTTLIIRGAFYPLSAKAVVAQRRMNAIQPKIKALQEKYNGNKEKQAKAIMELYKEEKVNPLSSILPTLVQIPFLFAIYRVFWNGVSSQQLSAYLYPFMPHITNVGSVFLGVLDLNSPSFLLAGIVGVLQYIQGKQLFSSSSSSSATKKKKGGMPDFQSMLQKQTVYVFPFIMVLITAKLPAAVGLYLAATFAFSILQQWYIMKKNNTATQPNL